MPHFEMSQALGNAEAVEGGSVSSALHRAGGFLEFVLLLMLLNKVEL